MVIAGKHLSQYHVYYHLLIRARAASSGVTVSYTN